MNVFSAVFVMTIIASTIAAPAENDGKYSPRKYKQDSAPTAIIQGRYYRMNEDGKYVPMMDRVYHHVDDMRELGRYVHIPNPYIHVDDLRLPYEHINDLRLPYVPNTDPQIPYIHQTDGIPYVHQTDASNYEQVSSGSAPYPNVEGYDIPVPAIPLKYGFPDHTPVSSGIPQQQYDSELPPPRSNEKPVELTNQAAVDIIDASALSSEEDLSRTIPVPRQKRSLIAYSQQAPTTTEAGKASGKDEAGTSGQGWYQYIGDDGKIYRVDYEVGPQGFVPKGTHIHKAIQKSVGVKEHNVV